MSSAAEFTLAPEEWIYEPVLVDRWGFLAKTILILERLKAHPSDNWEMDTENVTLKQDEPSGPAIQATVPSPDSHPSQAPSLLAEKTVAPVTAAKVQPVTSSSPPASSTISTNSALVAAPQEQKADSQPESNQQSMHSMPSSTISVTADSSSSSKQQREPASATEPHSAQHLSERASVDIDQLLSALVRDAEQHAERSDRLSAAQKHRELQVPQDATAPVSMTPTTASSSAAPGSSSVADSAPSMSSTMSSIQTSAVREAATAGTKPVQVATAASDEVAVSSAAAQQLSVAESAVVDVALDHVVNSVVEPKQSTVASRIAVSTATDAQADLQQVTDTPLNKLDESAPSTCQVQSMQQQNRAVMTALPADDSVDEDPDAVHPSTNAVIAEKGAMSQTMQQQGRAAMTALPDDDSIDEDAAGESFTATGVAAASAHAGSSESIIESQSMQQQSRAVTTALPDDASVVEDSASADSEPVADATASPQIDSANLSGVSQSMLQQSRAVATSLPDDDSVTEDLASTDPQQAADVSVSPQTDITGPEPASQIMQQQSRAAVTALPDDDNIEEDSADAENAPAAVVSSASETALVPMPTADVVKAPVSADAVDTDDAAVMSVTASDTAAVDDALDSMLLEVHHLSPQQMPHGGQPVLMSVSQPDIGGASDNQQLDVSQDSIEQVIQQEQQPVHGAVVDVALESMVAEVSQSSTEQVTQQEQPSVYEADVDGTLGSILTEVSQGSVRQVSRQEQQPAHEAEVDGALDSMVVDVSSQSSTQLPVQDEQPSGMPLNEAEVDGTLDSMLTEVSQSNTQQPYQGEQPPVVSPRETAAPSADLADKDSHAVETVVNLESALVSIDSAETGQQVSAVSLEQPLQPVAGIDRHVNDGESATDSSEAGSVALPEPDALMAERAWPEAPDWMQRAEQPETDAVVATEVDNVVEELRVAMSVGPAPGAIMQEQPQQQETSRVGAAEGDNMTEKVVYVISVPPASDLVTQEQPQEQTNTAIAAEVDPMSIAPELGSDVREQPQQPATSTVVACEVDGVLEELMIAMSIGPTLDYILAAATTEPRDADVEVDAASETDQAQVSSSDETLMQSIADSNAALPQLAPSTSAEVCEVVQEMTSTVVVTAEQQPAESADLETNQISSRSLPEAVRQQQVSVTAEVDQSLEELMTAVATSDEEPPAVATSDVTNSDAKSAEEDWEPTSAEDAETAAADLHSSDASVASDPVVAASSHESTADESTEEASQVGAMTAAAAAAAAIICVGQHASAQDGVLDNESAPAAAVTADTSVSPETTAADKQVSPVISEPTSDPPDKVSPAAGFLSDSQPRSERLTADVDQLLADLMPGFPPQPTGFEGQQTVSVSQHSTAVDFQAELAAEKGLAQGEAEEKGPHSAMTAQFAHITADEESQQASEGEPQQASEGEPQQATAVQPANAVNKAESTSGDVAEAWTAAVPQDSPMELASADDASMMDPRADASLLSNADGFAAVADVQSSDAGLNVPLDRDYDQCLEVVFSELTAEALGQEQSELAFKPAAAAPEAGTDGDAYAEDQFEPDGTVEKAASVAPVGMTFSAVALGVTASAAAVGMAASMAAASAAAQDMPARPASPVALQLAVAASKHDAVDQPSSALTAVAAQTHPVEAAAEEGDDNGYDSDVFDTEPEQASSSEVDQQLAGLERQVEQDDSSSSLSGASAESEVAADAEGDNQAQSVFADDAYDNEAFDNDEEQQTEAQPEASAQADLSAAKQPEMGLSIAQESEAEDVMAMSIHPREAPAQDSQLCTLPAQASYIQPSDPQSSDAQPLSSAPVVPMPLPAYSSAEVRPTRPSRAFMRRTSSLMKPDSSARHIAEGPTSLVAPQAPPRAPQAPPRAPQAPPGSPPTRRSRPHAPLVHQVSVSGKGSVGQPARIEAFWPSKTPPQDPPSPPGPGAAAPHRRRKLPKQGLVDSSPRAETYNPKVRLGTEESDVISLQELGRPLRDGSGGNPKEGDAAGRELTKHLEYDILQCMAKNRPEHLSWLVVKAREMGVRSSNPAVAAAATICKLTRRQAISKPPPILAQELADMRASLMAVDAILPRHCIMPGQIHASPVFDNASRAVQRLTLDNDATTAIAAGDGQAMEQVLDMAVRLHNQVVARRLQDALMRLDQLSASASGRSMPWSPGASLKGSPRSQEGLARLHDLASPVRSRSVHGSRKPSPAHREGSRGGGKGFLITDDIVQRLEEHDDEQAQLHSLWVAQKNEERRRQEAEAAAKLQRLPEWYLRDQGKRQGSNAQDFAAWREANAAALQEKTTDEMSTMYIRTIERELQKYRQEYKRRYNWAREANWQSDHVHVKQRLFDDTLQRPSDGVKAVPYTSLSVKS